MKAIPAAMLGVIPIVITITMVFAAGQSMRREQCRFCCAAVMFQPVQQNPSNLLRFMQLLQRKMNSTHLKW